MKELLFNPGAQETFCTNPHRASAYIGGLGSGKTFASIARGLMKSQQPKVGFYGPRGCLAAINYPVLKDVVLPQFFEMVSDSDLMLDYVKSEKKALLVPFNEHGEPDRTLVKKGGLGAAEVLFRSLDQPNWMRGLELAWFGIDEGRHLTREAWDVLYGRLRQNGYDHAGWVGSTPNGYDWMWTLFHPDSPDKLKDSEWYGAPTFDNREHLPAEYIESLLNTYEGRFLRQEVYGEFVGVVDGAVFFAWDHKRHTQRVDYLPNEDLYTFWDFGMGDLGVVVWAQVTWDQGKVEGQLVPTARVLEVMEAKDRTSKEWVSMVLQHATTRYGKLPRLNICDPAGRQRNVSTGTSIIQDCQAYGLTLTPAPKKPVDYAIRIVNNMLEGDRVVVDEDRAQRFASAMASHKWSVDSAGTRMGTKPVHDWTSHFADAFRYGITVLVGHGPRKSPTPAPLKPIGPRQSTYGDIMRQLDAQEQDQTQWLGGPNRQPIEWYPGRIG